MSLPIDSEKEQCCSLLGHLEMKKQFISLACDAINIENRDNFHVRCDQIFKEIKSNYNLTLESEDTCSVHPVSDLPQSNALQQ